MRSLLCDDLLKHEMTAAAMLSPHKMVQWTVGLTIREVLICDLRPQVGGIPCPCSFSFFLFPLFPLLVPSSLIPFLPSFLQFSAFEDVSSYLSNDLYSADSLFPEEYGDTIVFFFNHSNAAVRPLCFTCYSVSSVEKAVAPDSSTLAWKIPWTKEPGRLQSMGSQRVGHD